MKPTVPDYAKRITAAKKRYPTDPAKRQALRKKAGLSQNDVARELGITPAAVSEWERGICSPGPNNIVELVELLVKHGALKPSKAAS